MTVRSQRLQVVLSLEERKEQQALDRMNDVRRQWQEEQDRLEELQRYQLEYHQQMREQQQGTVPVARLQGWQNFIQACRAQEQRDRDLAEQKQSDEAAARQFSRRR